MQVVKVRAESMAAAAGMGRPHGMLSVVGLNDADLEAICKEVGGAAVGQGDSWLVHRHCWSAWNDADLEAICKEVGVGGALSW